MDSDKRALLNELEHKQQFVMVQAEQFPTQELLDIVQWVFMTLRQVLSEEPHGDS